MPRNLAAVHTLIVTCIDCNQSVPGNANTKRCHTCLKAYGKTYQRAHRRKKANERKHIVKPTVTVRKTTVTDSQVIAYLRAYAPKAYDQIITKIETLRANIPLVMELEKIGAN